MKSNDVLRYLIAAVGGLAAIWSASMLVGGFEAAGQLDSEFNPLGKFVRYVAAGAIVGAGALFFYVLARKKRTSLRMLVGSGAIVFVLTVFASVTQLVMVEDGSKGTQFVKGAEVRVSQGWSHARRIDQSIVDRFQAQVDFHEQRIGEEASTGKGPRYRASMRRFNQLRAEFGSALGRTTKIVQQGRSMSEDREALRSYLTQLRSKAKVFDRFAEREGLVAENFAVQLGSIDASLATLGQETYIDRKAIVYAKVMKKLSNMFATRGMADLSFTQNFLLSIVPDLIQILCAILLAFLRPREEPFENPVDDGNDWEPFDRVWGDSPSSEIH